MNAREKQHSKTALHAIWPHLLSIGSKDNILTKEIGVTSKASLPRRVDIGQQILIVVAVVVTWLVATLGAALARDTSSGSTVHDENVGAIRTGRTAQRSGIATQTIVVHQHQVCRKTKKKRSQ